MAFSEQELNIKEKVWISYYDSFKNGYNNTIGGDGTSGFNVPKGKDSYKPTKIICLNDLKIFECIIDASRHYNVSKSSISSNCSNNITKYSVKQKDGNSLMFMYFEDYLNSSKEEIDLKLNYKYVSKKGGQVYNARKIICLSTEEIFDSVSDAVIKYNLSQPNIVKCCKGERKYCGKLEGMKLTWMYYEDYLNTY